MNKFTLALALGTGLTLSLTAPHANADAITPPPITALTNQTMDASTFNKEFTQLNDAMSSNFQFNGTTGASGSMESQVFKGVDGSPTAGLYAYAYEVGVNNQTTSGGTPVNVQSASWLFNATPAATGITPSVYTITNGTVGGLTAPLAAAGQTILTPASVNFEPSTSNTGNGGSLVASFVNAAAGVPALNAGGNSATFVVITTTPPTQQFVNVQSPLPIAQGSSLTSVYSANGGIIVPVPAPEPTTILAWAGVASGLLVVRRLRKGRGQASA